MAKKKIEVITILDSDEEFEPVHKKSCPRRNEAPPPTAELIILDSSDPEDEVVPVPTSAAGPPEPEKNLAPEPEKKPALPEVEESDESDSVYWSCVDATTLKLSPTSPEGVDKPDVAPASLQPEVMTENMPLDEPVAPEVVPDVAPETPEVVPDEPLSKEAPVDPPVENSAPEPKPEVKPDVAPHSDEPAADPETKPAVPPKEPPSEEQPPANPLENTPPVHESEVPETKTNLPAAPKPESAASPEPKPKPEPNSEPEAAPINIYNLPSSSPSPSGPPVITLNYKSTVRGYKGTGTFKLLASDSFEIFIEKFGPDKDDIEVQCGGVEAEWYATPEIFLLDQPDATTLDVLVVSKTDNESSDDNSEPVATTLLIKINTPKGRLELQVRPDHTIGKIADWVAQQHSVDAQKITAEFEDEVEMDDTIEKLEIEDGDIIDMSW